MSLNKISIYIERNTKIEYRKYTIYKATLYLKTILLKNVFLKRGVFQNRGVCGQAFPLLPSPSPFHLFFCFRSKFRAITRLETLAT